MRSQFLRHRVDLGERPRRHVGQALPGRRQAHLARRAHEERRFQLLLEALDLARQGRLRDVQLGGGTREAAVAGRQQEAAQGVQVVQGFIHPMHQSHEN
ncbi:MAG: hypothetical protein CAPSK01_004160 [Candidatus Accumulibacter vicinus]|uniref:Uncharacterized protein n=1 Tax=Candidatus Accumulibacter vicinus TaxID=2954382 RepID=A0A084XVI7_9PROT|nr:MAG: hypothetical protein CAPSK01_004160 [Candidatus Accumulibacter vicinus]